MIKSYMNYDFLKNEIKGKLVEIDKIIENYINENNSTHKKYLKKTSLKNGKKARPILLFLLSDLFDIKHNELNKIASSLELLHISSLVHDDIIDKTNYRRGKKTFSSVFGNDVSLLWGDFLFLTALKLLNTIKIPELTNAMLDSSLKMVKGQILELENKGNLKINKDTYYSIIENKTASLFNFIGEVLIILNKDLVSKKNEILEFTNNIGLLFQIIDDVLDIYSDRTGKDKFNDFKENKITLPYIFLLKKIKKEEYFKIKDEEELLSLFNKYKIKDEVYIEIENIYQQALSFLNPFKGRREYKALIKYIDFIRRRKS